MITDEFLKEIGFKRTYGEDGSQYGKAEDVRTGITRLAWNHEGHSVTYFGEPLEPNVAFGIKKDGGTRTAFSGYVFSLDDVRHLLKMTW